VQPFRSDYGTHPKRKKERTQKRVEGNIEPKVNRARPAIVPAQSPTRHTEPQASNRETHQEAAEAKPHDHAPGVASRDRVLLTEKSDARQNGDADQDAKGDAEE
jgi:hypothetical protein